MFKTKKVYVVAEAGVNHNGNIKTAKRMIDVAAGAGADAVKFQTFRAEKAISRFTPKAEYQKRLTNKNESQLEMAKKLELSEEAHYKLYRHCKQRRITFMSAPFDLESIVFLNRLGLRIFKIPSGEITNVPYLRKIGSLKKKIIMSTGMADLKDIESALSILTKSGTPKKNITILHCVTDYPTTFKDVNLLAMHAIRDAFRVKVGYSDHTLGIEVPIAAAALGADVIEKHFTLDRKMGGPDHKASLEPGELKQMVQSIRNIEKVFGDGIKKPTCREKKNINIVRKSIVASENIRKGDVISRNNISIKRPGYGIQPKDIDRIIGLRVKRAIKKDSPVVWGMVR